MANKALGTYKESSQKVVSFFFFPNVLTPPPTVAKAQTHYSSSWTLALPLLWQAALRWLPGPGVEYK